MKDQQQDESYIANKAIERDLENESKVHIHGMYNVEAAPLVISEEPKKPEL
ncbi:hypothetical protein GKZ89_01655 [Bacillus mangrovi]|uniref:Uncharacterized protein n=1 Tax=Metabacillus mangrovi TaxID=1491830 RepID=A0A7X2V3H6_9BACI|nr:hypothetical protein [Metabacillus mangrovi]MTH52094.1 hypothetical protein [Metabacillus mangrovi]